MARPSLVLVHGSWHSPDHFDQLQENLFGYAYRCVLVALPSTQSPDTNPANLTDDTASIRNSVLSELDGGHDVWVIAHSYSGTPANNALKGLDEKSRAKAGASTFVRGIVFLNAIPAPAGKSFLDIIGGRPMAIHDFRVPGFVWVGAPGPKHYFYNETPEEQAQKYSAMLRPQSWSAYEGKTTYAAYLDFPCHYVHGTKDQAFPYEAQVGLISAAKAAGAHITTHVIHGDHTPFVGRHVGETSALIRMIAEDQV